MARLGAAHAIVDDIRTSLVDLCSEFIVPEDEDGSERKESLVAIEENVRFLAELLDRAHVAMDEAEAEDWQEGEGEVGDDEEEGEEDEGADAA
jgi:hypothetical protein